MIDQLNQLAAIPFCQRLLVNFLLLLRPAPILHQRRPRPSLTRRRGTASRLARVNSAHRCKCFTVICCHHQQFTPRLHDGVVMLRHQLVARAARLLGAPADPRRHAHLPQQQFAKATAACAPPSPASTALPRNTSAACRRAALQPRAARLQRLLGRQRQNINAFKDTIFAYALYYPAVEIAFRRRHRAGHLARRIRRAAPAPSPSACWPCSTCIRSASCAPFRTSATSTTSCRPLWPPASASSSCSIPSRRSSALRIPR